MSINRYLLLLLALGMACLVTEAATASRPLPEHPRLDRSVLRILDSADPLTTADRLGFRRRDGRVQIVAVVNDVTSAGGLAEWLRSRDARHVSVVLNVVQAHVDIATLADLGDHPTVRWVRRPMYGLRPLPPASPVKSSKAGQATTQGLAAMNGPAWHTAGFTGQGIKVGVIDMGWGGYEGLVGSDLPPWSRLDVRTFGGFVLNPNDGHGTRTTEVIYDIVPDAHFYLAMVETGVDVLSALDWMRDEGVNVIVEMLLFAFCGPGDGTGFFLYRQFAELTTEHDTLIVQGAGNYREEHWQGTSTDSDGDGWVEFSGNDEKMMFVDSTNRDGWFDRNDTINAYLVWNDWTAIDQDYALHLYRAVGSNWIEVAVEDGTQSGGEEHWPVESMVFRVETAGHYAVSVRRNRVDRVHDMELFTPRTARPEYSVSEGSIMTPADSPHVLTAGASLHTQPYTDFYFSSQGPTNGPGGTLAGGSVKPDITGYAEVDTVNHGPSRFSGTSAACPHVAGAAALAWSVRPTWSNLEIRAFLGATARDMGPAGKDNRYGMGRLYLGDPIRSMTECPVDVISDEDVFLDDGGSGSLLVSAASGCPWFAASHEQWIHIASGADGNGSGTVTYTVDHNPTTEPRQGRLLVAGTVVPVFQEAARLMPAPRRPSGRRQPGSADVDR